MAGGKRWTNKLLLSIAQFLVNLSDLEEKKKRESILYMYSFLNIEFFQSERIKKKHFLQKLKSSKPMGEQTRRDKT